MTPPSLAARIAFALLVSTMTIPCQAGEVTPHLTVGTQEISLSAGYLLPHRLTTEHTTKQSGPALMPSWAMVLTDPIGKSFYRGQLLLGAEIVYIQFQEPFLTHGVGFTPKIKYMFEGTGRLRPYIEFAGGPFYTDLGGRIPEESSRFNFILTAGGGLSWFFTSQFSFNVGYRFHHISNAGTRMPNLGLNSSLPFGGFSFYF
ncbi:MAG TPA: acyloxyacyl hydrolase [Nitrospira sp.]|nr:acyloxyacyl hydrolase [Nitrospira sp.]